ncbi:MAG: TIGR02206 family membrane protein [Oscillospiraceae bacterium]|nr:TIGR02206 family membrane protein [Oscillospiraceae bacterium]
MNFNYFWYTKDTIPDGVGFKLFGAFHISSILAAILIIACLAFAFKRLGEKGRWRMIVVVGCSLLANELFKDIFTLAIGEWKVEYLPFHICGINLMLSFVYLFTKNKVIAQILYALGIPGASMALLTPTWTSLPFFNAMHIHSYTVHICLILFPILLVINGERPTYKYFKFAYSAVLIYCVPIYFLNKALDTDFVFLNGVRDTPFEFLPEVLGDPWYIFPCALILGLLMAIMILPWHIIDKKKQKAS